MAEQNEKNTPVEEQRLEKEQIEDLGSVYRHQRPPRHPLPDRGGADRGPCGSASGAEDHQV